MSGESLVSQCSAYWCIWHTVVVSRISASVHCINPPPLCLWNNLLKNQTSTDIWTSNWLAII